MAFGPAFKTGTDLPLPVVRPGYLVFDFLCYDSADVSLRASRADISHSCRTPVQIFDVVFLTSSSDTAACALYSLPVMRDYLPPLANWFIDIGQGGLVSVFDISLGNLRRWWGLEQRTIPIKDPFRVSAPCLFPMASWKLFWRLSLLLAAFTPWWRLLHGCVANVPPSGTSDALPNIPSNTNRQSFNTLIRERSIRNKFVVSVTRSDAKSLIFQCLKSDKQRETKRIKGPSKRRIKMSHKLECPYTIRFFKSKGNLFNLLNPKNENELCHDLNLLSTSKGRKSILEQNSSARKIQNTISKDSPYNKLTKGDVKNMKSVYNKQTKEASQRASTEQANLLIQQMQSNGYMTFYDFDQTMFLNDSTYKTNNLGMPLVGIYGVANIGRRSFKSFPVPFA
ncbi:hypothetical protein EDC96DRAFT_573851 [Choanephora cucurbitarum]|nr:hypothetical protein EDC96DRAFT_573851 [Choanephora cucurbitarum]